MHDSTSAGEQISLFGTMQSDHLSAPLPVPNGGYLESLAYRAW
jgi:hypothetical protein